MRNTPNVKAERYRVTEGPLSSDSGYGNNGAFFVKLQSGVVLNCIVSNGGGWDHVSVRPDTNPPRLPNWDEMCAIKRLFWRDDECVVQFHPPEADSVNYHPFVLHLWKPQGDTISLPPDWMVAPKELSLPRDVPEVSAK